jgi:hypothetical protein
MVALAPPLSAELQIPTFEEIVRNLVSVNASLQTFHMDQVVDARILVLRYRLQTTVYAARPARYKVVVHNPPWFLRPLGDVFAHSGRPEDLLVNYAPRAVTWKMEGGRRILRVDLERQTTTVTPPSLETFVDPNRWLVERVVLHYEWGSVFAESRYEPVSEFSLPSAVVVRVPRYGLEAVLAYQNYRLNVFLPDSMFASK